jgi:hypothetical protein
VQELANTNLSKNNVDHLVSDKILSCDKAIVHQAQVQHEIWANSDDNEIIALTMDLGKALVVLAICIHKSLCASKQEIPLSIMSRMVSWSGPIAELASHPSGVLLVSSQHIHNRRCT